MNKRVLFVDDDTNILASFKRQLRKLFQVDTAQSGAHGLEKISKFEPYAVIVSDYRMPVMDGIQFLVRAREMAPDSVRMMLSGYADLDAAIEAINSGNIFRFLTKPSPPELLAKAVAAGIKQYQLVVAERELLQETLNGCIRVLSEVLELTNPEAFGRAARVAAYAGAIASELQFEDTWKLETAARLSQIGCIMLPEETLKKLYRNIELTPEETQVFNMHSFVAADLLTKIPRMEEVAEIIAHQDDRFDGSGPAPKPRSEDVIPAGARILKVALDFDALESTGLSKKESAQVMSGRQGWYAPRVLEALNHMIETEARYERKAVKIGELAEGMVIGQDLFTLKGRLLVKRGRRVTESFIRHLTGFARTHGLQEPLEVLVPLDQETTAS